MNDHYAMLLANNSYVMAEHLNWIKRGIWFTIVFFLIHYGLGVAAAVYLAIRLAALS